MRRSRSLCVAQGIGILAIAVLSVTSTHAWTQHGFIFKEYEEFHDVLHPLEHEALPQKDYRRIRAQAQQLVRLGNAILKVGVPDRSTSREEMEKELKDFSKALSRFARDAKNGTNAKLHKSYSAVHDSFEKLARLSEHLMGGTPPMASLSCPEESITEGDQITLHAEFPLPTHTFKWSVSAGKMIKGDKQDTIVLDTSGLAGVPIVVTAEVYDGNQHLVSVTCQIKVAARQIL